MVTAVQWIPSSAEKRGTFHQTLYGIQLQEGGGRAPFDRHAENVRPFKAKMRRPQLCPGIEKRDERPGHGIEELRSLPFRRLHTVQDRARFSMTVWPPCFSAMT
jgi:hypothetical protein